MNEPQAAGLGLVAYGAVFLVRNFSGFIELGLTPAHIGATPDEIRAFSPRLFNYISHLQVAIAGFISRKPKRTIRIETPTAITEKTARLRAQVASPEKGSDW